MEASGQWPPTAAELYLADSPARPVFQGDVFDDVPFAKARSAGDPARMPNLSVERRLVAVIGYPCDMYANGKLIKAQTVAPVTAAERAGIPPDWDGAYTFCPLIDVHGDGVPHAIDLRVAANIDASYLTTDRRVRSLSEVGWAILRQRLALCHTRALIPLDALMRIGRSLWHELDCWQRWNEAGRDPTAFQGWLDAREPQLSGFTRRRCLEHGLLEMVRAALERDLAS